MDHQQGDQPAPHPSGWAVKEEKEDRISVKAAWRTGLGGAGEHEDQFALPSLDAKHRFSSPHPIPAKPESQRPKGLFGFQPSETALGSPNPLLPAADPQPRAPRGRGERTRWAGECPRQDGAMQMVMAARAAATRDVSSKGDAESGRGGKRGRTQPGSAIHQGLKAVFSRKTHLNGEHIAGKASIISMVFSTGYFQLITP